MRKAILAILCVAAFVGAAITLPLHIWELFAEGWTDWSLGYLLVPLPIGASLLLVAAALTPWMPRRPAYVLAVPACVLATVAACYVLVEWCGAAETAASDVPLGESLGFFAPALLSASCFLRLHWSAPHKPGGHLWLILWGIGLLMALWWPWALFTTEGDPVIALVWFVYYGPSILLVATAIALWRAPLSSRSEA